MQQYNICYSLDSNYTEQLAVSITSILKNADIADNVNFYILDGGLTFEDKSQIELLKKIKPFNIQYISVDDNDFKYCPLLAEKDAKHKDYHVTLPTYFRFKLSDFLPDLEKVLYLDCDVIVKNSLKELFSINLNDYAVAMVKDVESKRESERLGLKNYFNAGVMLVNLDYWRKNNVKDKLFDYAKNNPKNILWQDQDIINIVLSNEIKPINLKWNYQYFLYDKINEKDFTDCSILHLAGRFKPWLMPFEHFVYDYYYYFLLLTPFRNRVIEYRQKASGKHLKDNIGGKETNILLTVFSDDIQKVYQEITKNYEYTNSLKEEIRSELDKQIDNVIQVQASTINSQTDGKINKVYDEITKNYEYTNSLKDEIKSKLDKQIDNVIQVQANTISAQTDEKISKVYDEITKNYEYTNSLRDEVNFKTDEKISVLKTEIEKNHSYTEYFFEILEGKCSQKVEDAVREIKKEIEQKEKDIYSSIDLTNSLIEEKSQNIKNDFNEIASILKDETTHRFSEMYAYSNEHFSRLYKGLKETSGNFEIILNDKVDNLYKNDEIIKSEVNSIKESLDANFSLADAVTALKQELIEQKNINNQKIVELQKEYEDRLNQQRIKYEKKLMQLEQSIEEDRKNPIVKLIEKIKKR